MQICPQCKKKFGDQAKFCDICGASLIKITNCPHCGKPTDETAGFCAFCGKPLNEKPEKDATAPEEKAAPEEQAVTEEKAAPEPAPYPAPAHEPAQQPDAPAKKQGGKKTGLIAAIAAIVVVILLIVIIASVAGAQSKISKMSFFEKDGELYYSDFSGRAKKISEHGGSNIVLSKNGKVIVYTDDFDGALYVKKLSNRKDPVKITSGVNKYEINDAGSVVTLLKNGDLYQYNVARDDLNRVKKDVDSFLVSANGRKIVYLTNRDDSNSNKVGCIVNGKDKGTFASDVQTIMDPGAFKKAKLDKLYFYKVSSISSNDFDSWFEKRSYELYTVKLSGSFSPKKIAGNVTGTANFTDGTMYYIVKNDEKPAELFYFDGKRAYSVDKNVNRMIVSSSLESAAILYTKGELSETVSDYTYCIAVKKKASEIDKYSRKCTRCWFSANAKTAYFVNEEESALYQIKLSSIGKPTVKKYDSDVLPLGGFMTDKLFVYFKGASNGKADMYINKKRVDTDVSYDSIVGAGKYVYYLQDSTLKVTTGSKGKKVSADVDGSRNVLPNGKLLYVKDTTKNGGDLFYYNGATSKKLSTDVTKVETVESKDYIKVNYYNSMFISTLYTSIFEKAESELR